MVVAFFFAENAFAALAAKSKKNASPKPKAKISLQSQLKKELYADFSKKEIDDIFADTRLEIYKPVVSQEPPCSYFDPCFGLLSDRALATGFAFWSGNKEYFEKAKKIYGVDADAILGILRIETYLGKGNMGRWKVFNALYTIYTSSPKKRKWAVSEMKSFIKTAHRNDWDIFTIQGSTAGAFGIPQFIPSSYLNPNLVADGDGDGVIDLWNEADAIMSVAKYLSNNGWGASSDAKKKAVLAYNHESSYANAVLIYARVMSLLAPYRLEKPPTP